MLSIEHVGKVFGEGPASVSVLNDLSLHVDDGEFCALTGPSGSGKTTLMNLIGLLDRPTSGSIDIAGRPVTRLSADEAASLRRYMIGFVFQGFHLLSRYTALDNVALPLLYHGVDHKERRRRAAIMLRRVGLHDRMAHRPHDLSGGQRQRVAIARALIGKPRLLLADEPTGNLDSRTADEIMSLLSNLNAENGLTIIIVTHDPTIAARCRRRIALRDGRIVDEESQRLNGGMT
jgi:putative ABC transport system ATP-binding protein